MSATITIILDEHGDQVFATSDAIAERGRKIGGKIMHSIGHISRLPRILDNDAEFARAWVDPEFRARRSACEERGISFLEETRLIVPKNTDKIHNLIVRALCSCYPRGILGLPPRLIQAEALQSPCRHRTAC
jgi:hypothetical protein